MLLISGALVNGPYALITTAVSADLVSLASPVTFGSRENPLTSAGHQGMGCIVPKQRRKELEMQC